MKSARFEDNRAHLQERIIERYRKRDAAEADEIINRVMDVLREHTPYDWRFTESPSSRFFIVDQATEAKFMGLSYREAESDPRPGREIVQLIQDSIEHPIDIINQLDSLVDRYVADVRDPNLGIIHNIRTVYKRGEKAYISEEKDLFDQARSSQLHVIPLGSHRIAARPNAIVADDGALWVRQYLNWVSVVPNSKEYFLFQPLTRNGIEKCRFTIFSYFNDGRVARVGDEQKFHCGAFLEALSREKARASDREIIRSENYWKVPTYFDRRLIDLDFKERHSKGEKGKEKDTKILLSANECLELFYLRAIVDRARMKIPK
jgi:hypothetical protein